MGKILIIKGADFSKVAVGVVEPINPVVSSPKIIISSSGNVSISSDTGTSIYYTINGSTPTTSSTKYITSFNVTNGTIVKAIAVDGMGNKSNVASKMYTESQQQDVLLYDAPEPDKNWTAGIFDAYPNNAIQNRFRGRTITKIKLSFNGSGVFSIRKARNVATGPWENIQAETIQTFNVVSGENILIFDTPFTLSENEWLGIGAPGEISSSSFLPQMKNKAISELKFEFFYSSGTDEKIVQGGTGDGVDASTGDNLAFDVYGY